VRIGQAEAAAPDERQPTSRTGAVLVVTVGRAGAYKLRVTIPDPLVGQAVDVFEELRLELVQEATRTGVEVLLVARVGGPFEVNERESPRDGRRQRR